jgi:hypothetical protein
MTDDSTFTISDRFRRPLVAHRQHGGGVFLRSGHSCLLILSEAELNRLFEFAHEPQLGRLERFPMATKSPQTDEQLDGGQLDGLDGGEGATDPERTHGPSRRAEAV